MIQELRTELRKIGTHGYNTRLYAVLWTKEGRPDAEVRR